MNTCELTSSIELSGDLTISSVDRTYALINDALARSARLVLNIDAEADVDISFIQLIEAARSSSASNDVELTLAAPATGHLANALERGGFLGGADDPATRFWRAER